MDLNELRCARCRSECSAVVFLDMGLSGLFGEMRIGPGSE